MRIHLVQKQLRAQKLCGLILSTAHEDVSNPNISYFFSNDLRGLIVIPVRKKPAIILSPLEEAPSGIRVLRYASKKELVALLKKELQGKRVAIDTAHCSAQTYLRLKRLLHKSFVSFSGACEQLRAVKSNGELRLMEQACRISDAILRSCIARFSSFRTEHEVEQFLIAETKKQGCGLAFPPIVASGKNAACPHYHAKNKKLQNGFCVLDFGVRFKGYCTDTTRTIYLGAPTKHEREVYDRLRVAQELLITKSRPGVSCASLHREAEKLLGHDAKYFIHSLGHGVGLEIHEAPAVSSSSKETLAKNMVITIEPGIYLSGDFGIRIEDTLVVGSEPRSLTRISKELITIPLP